MSADITTLGLQASCITLPNRSEESLTHTKSDTASEPNGFVWRRGLFWCQIAGKHDVDRSEVELVSA